MFAPKKQACRFVQAPSFQPRFRRTQVGGVNLETGAGRGGSYTTYIVRATPLPAPGAACSAPCGAVSVSFFVMWPEGAAAGAYSPGQVEAFQALLQKWGPIVSFTQPS